MKCYSTSLLSTLRLVAVSTLPQMAVVLLHHYPLVLTWDKRSIHRQQGQECQLARTQHATTRVEARECPRPSHLLHSRTRYSALHWRWWRCCEGM